MANAINFSDTTPAAPGGYVNIKWQKDGSTPPNVSGYVPISVPSAYPAPNTQLNVLEEFLGGGNAGVSAADGICGELGWHVVLTGAGAVSNVDDTLNGVCMGTEKLESPTSSDAALIFLPLVGSGYQNYSTVVFDMKWRARMTATTSVEAFLGLYDAGTLSSGYPQNGIYFDLATAKGTCVSSNTASQTSALITPDTNYHDYRFRSNTPGTILFSVDNGAESSIATNVPTAALGIAARIQGTTGSDRAVFIDFMWHSLTAAR